MPDHERHQPDLHLTPQLDYAPPAPPRPWIELASHALDLVGGWLGAGFIVGIYAILLAPYAGMLAAIPILFGTVILQIAILFWLKKR